MDNNTYGILLIDDEPDILEFTGYNLRKEGYRVYTANSGKEGIAIAKKVKPDLIVLDIMMPEMDGIETCREIRETPGIEKTLITFLTARNEDYSQIAGLETGADDYISKPIKPALLLSRIRTLLRRIRTRDQTSPTEEAIEAGNIKIDREKRIVTKDNIPFYLPKKEFDLIALLASKPGKVFSRENILSTVWGEHVVIGDRTIDVHIRKLREKLGEHLIKTLKGVGYKFEPQQHH